jgi:ABC-type nitrate/sulfonate/bicarbonate transport system substrate-binding protein
MRPLVVCVLLVAALAILSCKTIKPVTLDELRTLKPDQVWVTQSDQTVVLVSSPQVVSDTLVGYINGTYEELPAARIKQVRMQRGATTRTALLIGAIAAGFGGMVYALIGGKGDTHVCDPSYCEEHGEDPCCV